MVITAYTSNVTQASVPCNVYVEIDWILLNQMESKLWNQASIPILRCFTLFLGLFICSFTHMDFKSIRAGDEFKEAISVSGCSALKQHNLLPEAHRENSPWLGCMGSLII